jgi:putative DNA primase/helicase
MAMQNIPEMLKELPQWVCWKAVQREGKPKIDKVPINPKNGYNSKSNDPNTWDTFEVAVNAQAKYKLTGIGFMFANGVFGIDIDHCVNDEGIDDLARDVIETIDSYTEYSPSGTGIHIICKGTIPTGERRCGKLEMYNHGRFFTMTGKVLDDAHTVVEERTQEVAKVHEKYMKKEKKKTLAPTQMSSANILLGTEDIIKKALSAKDGPKFEQLYRGNWEGSYPSQSNADMAFCNLLAFWTNKNASLMHDIFRQSGLYREKWDEGRGPSSYGNITINKAIEDFIGSGYENEYKKRRGGKNLQMTEENDSKEIESLEAPHPDQEEEGININNSSNVIKLQPKQKEWLMKSISKEGNITYRINETAFVSELQSKNKMYYINGKMYDHEGLIPDGNITKEIQSIIEPWIVQSQAQKTRALYDALCIKAYYEPPMPKDNEIHFKNVSLRINGKSFEEIKDPDFSILKIPHEFDRNAMSAPKWEAYLNTLLFPEDVLTVQEYLGYCFLPTTKGQKALFVKSNGGEGKSILTGVIQSIFSNYCIKDTVQGIIDNKFKLATLENRLVFVDDDLNTAGLKDTGTWKSIITNNGKRAIEEKGKDTRDANIFIRYFCLGNSDITSLFDNSDAFYDRIIALTTRGIKIRGTAQDNKNLASELLNELPAIINWALLGLLRLHKNNYNFTTSKTTDENIQNIKTSNDSVTAFLASDYLEFGDYNCFVSDIFESYKLWCDRNGEEPKKGFPRYFKQTISESKKLNVKYNDQLRIGNRRDRGYQGIRLSSLGTPPYILSAGW